MSRSTTGRAGRGTASALLAITVCAVSIMAVAPARAAVRRAPAVEHRATAAPSQTLSVAVNVNAAHALGVIPPTAFGINTATWDGNLFDQGIPTKLRALGMKVLRWPGGSFSDTFNWSTAKFAFDQFVALAKKAGAQPLLTVNYGTGTPQEAAAWVKYANVTKKYGIQYWEIGNEIYGDGEYQNVSWEQNLHKHKGPHGYGVNALEYIRAMRAVDPHIHIGVVLTVPGVWPSGIAPYWDRTLLPVVAKNINFVVLHWYAQNPGKESDSGLLASTSAIPGYMAQVRSYLAKYAGANAKNIQVFVDETNSVSFNPGKQTVGLVNALFLANDYMTWLQNGAANVDWWDLHNSIETGNNVSQSLYGNAQYGDYGILSSGESKGGISEPPLNTPFPPYYGLLMLNRLAKPGDRMVAATSSDPLLAVHAVKQTNGDLSVLIVNEHAHHSVAAHLKFAGYRMAGPATVYTYGEGSRTITARHAVFRGSQPELTAGPYSLTDVLFTPILAHPGK